MLKSKQKKNVQVQTAATQANCQNITIGNIQLSIAL